MYSRSCASLCSHEVSRGTRVRAKRAELVHREERAEPADTETAVEDRRARGETNGHGDDEEERGDEEEDEAGDGDVGGPKDEIDGTRPERFARALRVAFC